ncbi:MAG: DGQHR domain-containing protein [Trichodesmium erythraeum GBRTRLIN201]|nr:DGQHR domain-containing protein [Trichodesmium erythraeum GBRTRLIN201]
MIKKANKPTSEIAKEILENDNREKEAIAILLDKHIGKDNRLLVQKTMMGNTEAYIGSVTLEWLDSRVRFASQLPLFRQKFDIETDNIIRDSETIDEIQQRPLDWSRQAPLTLYLATRKSHKFPAVLVVISPSWVDNPKAEEWNKNGEANKSATDFFSLDSQGKVGLLDLRLEVAVFALDGQHRLMGIQGLMELIKTGRLPRYNKQKKSVGAAITIDDLTITHQIELPEIQKLAYEQIGIEFIPAVVKGETRAQARRRVRSVFAHVNLTAVKLSKGQLALLNEDDGFAIVARKIAIYHPILKEKDGRNPRINWDSATVAANSTVLTTLQALQEMSERYLKPRYPYWKPSDRGLIPMRPAEEELEEGVEEFMVLWNYLSNLPSYSRLENGSETSELRRFSFERKPGEGHVLFRPIGQIAFAEALGILIYKKEFSLKEVFHKLNKYDVDGGLSGIEFPDSIWYGVLYDFNRKRMSVAGRDLAMRLFIYILGGVSDKMERAEVRRQLAQARRVGEDQAVDFQGKFVELKKVGLPEILY